MIVKSEKDILALKEIGKIVALAREEMIKAIKPGISTKTLDEIADKILSKYGAKSAPRYEYDFPGITCISINEEAAHGIPGSKIINQGDIVNIDVSAELNGYFADTGATIPVGEVTPLKNNLINCSRSALNKAISLAKAGNKLNLIGETIENEAKVNGFAVVKNLYAHGIGKSLHEDPLYIFNYRVRFDKRLLENGMVLAIETFISTGAERAIKDKDGWTLRTPDGSFVAQFEHTIIVNNGSPIIITT